jgi:hypothetical protein
MAFVSVSLNHNFDPIFLQVDKRCRVWFWNLLKMIANVIEDYKNMAKQAKYGF